MRVGRIELVLGLACLLTGRPGSIARAQVLSPGQLSSAHAALETRCTACHSRERAEPQRCLACHGALAARIRAGKGYHARVATGACGGCHLEHQGRGFPLIRRLDEKSFDHRAATGYALKGKHRALSCRTCHRPSLQMEPAVRRLGAGARARTFLGLRGDCASCHRDVHAGALGVGCASCHDEEGFKPVTRFGEHSRTRFPLIGKHAGLACARCHRGSSGAWRFRGLAFGSCADCHRSPHGSQMGQRGGGQARTCGSCHLEGGWRQLSFAAASHPASLPLQGGHARAPCRACHGVKASQAPRGTACASCHRDPHQGRFGSGCNGCHTVAGWRGARGGRPVAGPLPEEQSRSAEAIGVPGAKLQAAAFHNKTGYPLTGKHLLVPCDGCHRRGKKTIYRKIAHDRCEDCHTDPHRPRLSQARRATTAFAASCQSCHSTLGWALTSFSLERHQQTRFPLQGAHRAVSCRACHRQGKLFSWKSLECEGCHRDPHRGRYRLEAARAAPCRTCHQQSSFTALAFAHDRTRFPLRGAHARTACRSCHRPDARGITVFAGLGTSCGSCHADPHRGQFTASAPQRSCGDCHRDSSSFKLSRFDHQRLTRFPLEGAHRRAACSSCHRRAVLPGGASAIAYRLGEPGCDGCHRSPHRDLESRRLARLAPAVRQQQRNALSWAPLTRCRLCHQTGSWRELRSPQGFDHALTGYRLEGRHLTASCDRCHRSGQAISRQCSGCHADPHAGRLGKTCSDCHRPTSWTTPDILARHRRTRLPLTGWHALADCASCHPQAREGRYRGVPAACVGCHADRYRDPATHPDHARAGFDTRCERCHRPSGWSPAIRRTGAALVGHSRFNLRGRHRQLDCLRCHSSGRPSPRCSSCHVAARRGSGAPDHQAAGFPGDCQRCHGESSWRPARFEAHQRRFPLSGKHRGLGCSDCHLDATDFRRASCLGSCHPAQALATRHRAGFVAESRACLRCHPSGRR